MRQCVVFARNFKFLARFTSVFKARQELFIYLLKLYLFTLTPSAIADFQGGRANKKKTIYINTNKDSKQVRCYDRLISEIKELKVFIDIDFPTSDGKLFQSFAPL